MNYTLCEIQYISTSSLWQIHLRRSLDTAELPKEIYSRCFFIIHDNWLLALKCEYVRVWPEVDVTESEQITARDTDAEKWVAMDGGGHNK